MIKSHPFLVSFLANALIFGCLMALIDYGNGDPFDLKKFIFLSITFGLGMALFNKYIIGFPKKKEE